MRSSKRHAAAFFAAIVSGLTTLSAPAAWSQSEARCNPALGVLPGERVRLIVNANGNQLQTGTIGSVRCDSIVFRREGAGDSVTIGVAQVTRLDVSRGRHSRALTGLEIGLASGGGLGAVIGLAASSGQGSFCCSTGQNAVAGAIAFGVVGGVIGLVAGSFAHTERWHTVPLTSLAEDARANVTLMPSAQGPRVGIRFSARF